MADVAENKPTEQVADQAPAAPATTEAAAPATEAEKPTEASDKPAEAATATTTEEKPVGMFTSRRQCSEIATYIIVQTTLSPTPTRELHPTSHTPPKEPQR